MKQTKKTVVVTSFIIFLSTPNLTDLCHFALLPVIALDFTIHGQNSHAHAKSSAMLNFKRHTHTIRVRT